MALLGIAAVVFDAVRGPVVGGGVVQASPAARAGDVPAPARAAAGEPVTRQFRRHALNALLVPLLDDHSPPLWTDVAMRFFCGPATRVEIDGRPLVPGAAMPATAFTVRWQIDQCWPLDYAAFELSGRVELQVFHDETDEGGLSAVIDARHLRIATARGSRQIDTLFAAAMELGTGESPPPVSASGGTRAIVAEHTAHRLAR